MARNNGGKTVTKSPARYMLSGLARNKGVTTFALILTVISTLLITIPSIIIGMAVDELLQPDGVTPELTVSPLFITYVWIIIGLAVLYMGLFFFVGYVWAIVTLRWERDARQDFFEALQDYSMTFHDEVDSKRLLSVAMQDISWVRFSLNPALRNLAGAFISFGITIIILIQIDFMPSLQNFLVLNLGGFSIPIYGFTAIMIIGTPIYMAFSYRYANAIEPVRRKRSEDMEQLTATTQGVFSGIEVVRAFGKEDYEQTKFHDVSKTYEKMVAKEGRLAAFYIPALVMIAMTSLAFLYASYAVINNAIEPGTLVTIMALLMSLEGFNFMLPRMLLMIRGGYVNAQRIVDILNWKETLIEPEEEVPEVDWLGDIVFENVSFKYGANNNDNEHYALKDFNITIPGGSRVALIGGPGGGKSSILKLLLRLYDPTEGTIRIGNVNLHDVNTETVRNVVGLVEQDIFLFRMSVRDNIAFGRDDATHEEIVEAAKRAQADEFIVELPEGYDSMIGERGMTLSGGQRQRLAIARAIIQDPKILLLDDSVSAVDAQTEFLMRKALEEVMVNRTSITVTQRLRTLIESDLVIIVDKGRIIAAGCHEDLLRDSDHYRKIFERLPGAQSILAAASAGGGGA
ncbi:MAG: putative multidrug export ATP-binding/permease protein [Candidatus Thorarchaeota archaeon AB_25]|nr:MAG: putative multidrug export ATP-binding/permease protein [Candidatus Thorarchaeota archaeon AB_25]